VRRIVAGQVFQVSDEVATPLTVGAARIGVVV